ncbi:MAG: Serine/threonine protein kinase [uncultured Aureispira sp.]|uniref:non-specific serine/threonine protein kinase n=1 Tax=uncultured Aureispira sp. TaxID=1331704 RepID=A0A6S6SHW1_9BACT|nr:MAG: Serine/threonine protein kinase [uncultured Aureispira sp.]
MKVRHTSTHEMLILEKTPFAQGGEGSLYKVLTPIIYQHLVAKIYHSNKRTKQRQHKLRYLIEHPPVFESKTQQQLISWPMGLLEQGQRFVGFLMPRVEGELLEVLATAKLPKSLSKKWQRFKLGTDGALALRQKVCFNIAVALYHIHETGHYVMVDLKPDNILIQPNGLISLVDMDSIEIVAGNQVLFPAAMATPEFAPPEFHVLQRSAAALPISWDAFSMAIIFYKILLGIHPFAATTKGRYETATGLGEKLKHGLYVHNKKQQACFAIIPPLHQAFYKLPTVLQYLFNLCFVHGIAKPTARPSAEDWCLVFGEEQTPDKQVSYQLEPKELDLYQPKLEAENSHWLTGSFEELFKRRIQEAAPSILKRIKKEQQNGLLSVKGLWKRMAQPFQAKIEYSTVVQNLSIEEIPVKWQPFFYQKVQLLFDLHSQKKTYYKEEDLAAQLKVTELQAEWQAYQSTYFDKCHQLKKSYRKKCFEVNQNRNEQPLWKAFVGKTVARKQAFLKQKYLPVQEQDLAETYQQKTKVIDTFYQPKWEALEKAHYERLDQINKNKKQTVLKKQEEETHFVKERQLIIEAIQSEKDAAKLEYTSHKKLLDFSIKNYIEQLEAIESNAANQIKVIEQSATLKFMKLADDALLKKQELNRRLLDLETSFKKLVEESVDRVNDAASHLDATLMADKIGLG